MFKFSPSKLIVFFITAILVWLNIKYKADHIISWDVFGYYLYLPAQFIYHDLALKDISALNSANELYHMTPYYYQFTASPTGGNINIYQAGMAILYLPFFLIGHLIAFFTHYPQDGFSLPYQYSVWIGGMLYSFFGLLVLRKVLLCFFKEWLSSIILILIILGTNYLLHSSIYASNLMTANFMFTLYAALLYFTIKWHENLSFKYIIPLAITGSLMFLARPIELLAFSIPLLWNIHRFSEIKFRWQLIKSKKEQFVVFFLIFFLFLSIQLIYNKIVTNEFFVSGYKSYGEDGFYPTEPHLINVLFSFRKGWLIYTPLMIFSIIGFYHLYKKKSGIFISVLIFTFLYVYAVSSWSCWWYAASFSQRALIQILPVMAIPLGFFIQSFQKSKFITKIGLAAVLLFFVLLNLFQSWQYSVGILNESRMTSAYYFSIFGKTNTTPEQQSLLLFDRATYDESAPVDTSKYFMAKEIKYDYEASEFASDTNYKSTGALKAFKVNYPIGIKIPVTEITEEEYAIVEIHFRIYPLDTILKNQTFAVIHQKHHHKQQKYRAYDISHRNLIPNQWNTLTYFYATAEFKSKSDKFEFYLNNPSLNSFYIDDVILKIFEKKK